MRCSRSLVEMCRHVSPAYTELHPSQVNIYGTQERRDLGTESFTFIRFLILKEDNASLILRLLQYLLINVQTLRWEKLEKGRYDSLL